MKENQLDVNSLMESIDPDDLEIEILDTGLVDSSGGISQETLASEKTCDVHCGCRPACPCIADTAISTL